LFGGLRIEHLYVVAAATGVLTVLFDVAFRTFVWSEMRPPNAVHRCGITLGAVWISIALRTTETQHAI
jgi:hypothetical protein